MVGKKRYTPIVVGQKRVYPYDFQTKKGISLWLSPKQGIPLWLSARKGYSRRRNLCFAWTTTATTPTLSHLLVGHADAGLSQRSRAKDEEALEERGEVDPELGTLRAVVLLKQASFQDALRLRVLGSSRHYQRHGLASHLF